jgi:hypothetical protein
MKDKATKTKNKGLVASAIERQGLKPNKPHNKEIVALGGAPRFEEDIEDKTDTKIDESSVEISDTWRNRRRMAYFSLFSIMLVTYWALFVVPESRLKILGEVITWFYFVMASVVGGYVGFSAFEKKWNSNSKNK